MQRAVCTELAAKAKICALFFERNAPSFVSLLFCHAFREQRPADPLFEYARLFCSKHGLGDVGEDYRGP